jgi:hypothetical protein
MAGRSTSFRRKKAHRKMLTRETYGIKKLYRDNFILPAKTALIPNPMPLAAITHTSMIQNPLPIVDLLSS